MANDMEKLGVAAIGIMILVIIFGVIPMVGEKMDDVQDLGATSQWNDSVNADIVTGAELWADTGGMIVLAAIISVVGVVIVAVMAFRRKTGE